MTTVAAQSVIIADLKPSTATALALDQLSPHPVMVDVKLELRTVKSRVGRLQEVFNALPLHPPGLEEWPFWLERFNALSGQYSGLERELSGGVFGDVLLEPVSVPRDLTVSSDAVPNILLRSKLAPEVTASVQEAVPLVIDETRKKLYRSTVRMLQERFAQIQEELQGAVAEQTSALLADALTTPSMLSRAMESRLSAASLGSHPTSKVASLTSSIDSVSTTGAMAVDDREAFLETAIRWLYTGQQ